MDRVEPSASGRATARQRSSRPTIAALAVSALAVSGLAGCGGSTRPATRTAAQSASPTPARYASELNAFCRTHLLSAGTAAAEKSITTSSAPLATQESEIITQLARPFATRLLAITPPAGNPTAADLRANVRRDVALDADAVKDLSSHNTTQLRAHAKAQTAAEAKVDADADKLGARLCDSY